MKNISYWLDGYARYINLFLSLFINLFLFTDCVGIMKKPVRELTSLALSNKPSCKSLKMDLVCLQVIYPLVIRSLLLHFVLNTERKNEFVQICSLEICRKFVKTEE